MHNRWSVNFNEKLKPENLFCRLQLDAMAVGSFSKISTHYTYTNFLSGLTVIMMTATELSSTYI